MKTKLNKTPRLYVESDLRDGVCVSLEANQTHYLANVMRVQDGTDIRVFNGRHGEWVGAFQKENKKQSHVVLSERIKSQNKSDVERRLYFTPLKKNRLDFLIEKSVELGVTRLSPILTQNTDIRKFNNERTMAQIIEACEQCERLSIPQLDKIVKLEKMTLGINKSDTKCAVALERCETSKTLTNSSLTSVLIGPEGGFSEKEINLFLSSESFVSVTLGETILRAETAALVALTQLQSM